MTALNRRRVPPRGSKQWLLPMPHESVRSLSLNAHLALEACREGRDNQRDKQRDKQRGNQAMLNELTRLTYLSYFLWQTGLGHANDDTYAGAEDALNAAVERAQLSGEWMIGSSEVAAIEALLKVYDEQLASVTARDYCGAIQRLNKLLETPRTVSPVIRHASHAV